MADSLTFTQTVVTLPSSSPTQLVGRNTKRLYLAIQNTGTAPVTLSFFSSGGPTSASSGLSLDPAISGNLQGGNWEWTEAVPSNAIYGYSAAGTIVVVVQG